VIQLEDGADSAWPRNRLCRMDENREDLLPGLASGEHFPSSICSVRSKFWQGKSIFRVIARVLWIHLELPFV